jgi:hypothetical protein
MKKLITDLSFDDYEKIIYDYLNSKRKKINMSKYFLPPSWCGKRFPLGEYHGCLGLKTLSIKNIFNCRHCGYLNSLGKDLIKSQDLEEMI